MDDREYCENCGVEKNDVIIGHNDGHTGLRRWWCSMACLEVPTHRAPLLLIRGLPGSGKSTRARSKSYRNLWPVHLEAAMYHMKMGKYVYEVDKAGAAHRWCLDTTRIMLNNGKRVVVTNTFVRLADIRPYLELGFDVAIETATGTWGSVHNVPEPVLASMRSLWESLP